MGNANYIKGRNFEYKVMKDFRERGYEVMRTAGSHGPFDIIAVRPMIVDMIQCKVVKSKAEGRRLIEKFRENPPMKPLALPVGVHQVLCVKVRGCRVYEEYYV